MSDVRRQRYEPLEPREFATPVGKARRAQDLVRREIVGRVAFEPGQLRLGRFCQVVRTQ